MVQSFFGMCPGVCTWFEPRTVWTYADPGRRHDHFTHDDVTPKVKRYIRARFLKYQTQHDGQRVMEKTPSNILRATYVHEIFPESKLIFVIREPLAQLSSSEFRWHNALNRRWMMHRFMETPKTQLHHSLSRLLVDQFRKKVLRKKRVSIWGVRYPGIYDDKKSLTIEQLIAKQWSEGARICREECAQINERAPGTVLTMRYEDIVASPRESFARMAQHVGLDVPDSVLDEIEQRADTEHHRGFQLREVVVYPDLL